MSRPWFHHFRPCCSQCFAFLFDFVFVLFVHFVFVRSSASSSAAPFSQLLRCTPSPFSSVSILCQCSLWCRKPEPSSSAVISSLSLIPQQFVQPGLCFLQSLRSVWVESVASVSNPAQHSASWQPRLFFPLSFRTVSLLSPLHHLWPCDSAWC